MMKFKCANLGLDCTFVASAVTKDELVELFVAHANEAHHDAYCNLDPESVDAIETKIEPIILLPAMI